MEWKHPLSGNLAIRSTTGASFNSRTWNASDSVTSNAPTALSLRLCNDFSPEYSAMPVLKPYATVELTNLGRAFVVACTPPSAARDEDGQLDATS